jgi:pyruvate/2-oxoglutarate dehydrogenase complex dihydrolipoamide acyltransferase (E2) component
LRQHHTPIHVADTSITPDGEVLTTTRILALRVCGIVWATPIPLPEQNLVLGLGAGSKVPRWSDEVNQFIPVTEAELTLSFDHRILDGGGAGRLLARVAQLLQQPEKL